MYTYIIKIAQSTRNGTNFLSLAQSLVQTIVLEVNHYLIFSEYYTLSLVTICRHMTTIARVSNPMFHNTQKHKQIVHKKLTFL